MSSTGLPGWLSLRRNRLARMNLQLPNLPTLNSTGAPSASATSSRRRILSEAIASRARIPSPRARPATRPDALSTRRTLRAEWTIALPGARTLLPPMISSSASLSAWICEFRELIWAWFAEVEGPSSPISSLRIFTTPAF